MMKNELKKELCRLLKLIEDIPCVLPKKEEKGIFYDLKRVEKIDEEINQAETDYKWIKGKNYYRLYAQDSLENISKEFPRVLLVSSHADNLQNASSYDDESKPGFINGCFDNASTNAVCVYLMKYVDMPKNVLFVFTADEEQDSEGAEHVAKKIEQHFGKGNADVIVLDVTYGFQNAVDFTIENDFIRNNDAGNSFIHKICDVANGSEYSWNFLHSDEGNEDDNDGYVRSKEIRDLMGEGCKNYIEVDGEDETTKYKDFKMNTFSLCLPCSAENNSQMHDEKGFQISIDTICKYLEFLRQIIES